jgi:hypothetical protein
MNNFVQRSREHNGSEAEHTRVYAHEHNVRACVRVYVFVRKRIRSENRRNVWMPEISASQCAVRCAVCGVRCAVCGVRCAVCGVRCVRYLIDVRSVIATGPRFSSGNAAELLGNAQSKPDGRSVIQICACVKRASVCACKRTFGCERVLTVSIRLSIAYGLSRRKN